MDIVFAIMFLMGGSILILLRLNKTLKRDKKLKDLEIEDTKLETKQGAIKEEKAKLKDSLSKISANLKELSDKQIEDFWKDKKGK